MLGIRLRAVFYACHVEDLRDDPQGTADHLKLVHWGLFLGELVESTYRIEPQSLILKILLDLQSLESVVSPLNNLLDLQIEGARLYYHKDMPM